MEWKGKEYWFCSPNCDLDDDNDCEECKKIYEERTTKDTTK